MFSLVGEGQEGEKKALIPVVLRALSLTEPCAGARASASAVGVLGLACPIVSLKCWWFQAQTFSV